MSSITELLTPLERRIVDLLLQGCENGEIAKELGMARRTVKAHFNRMFMKAGLSQFTGIKRVKLAVMLLREQKETEAEVGIAAATVAAAAATGK